MRALYDETLLSLSKQPRSWLVTGVAGFIGSNLLEQLLRHGQRVVGVDNFSTGFHHNLDGVRLAVGEEAWGRFELIEGDVSNIDICRRACTGVELVLHQAALGSVPRSINDPIASNKSNIDGTLAMLVAAKDAGVKRFVFAGSSSTYGDHPGLPKVEDKIGKPLSPYAVTKYVGEMYGEVFGRIYDLPVITLRYFNVFGRRQNPNGDYAAVIPRWIGSLLRGETCVINGDGETSRDFTYVDNVVQANLLAAVTERDDAIGQSYNVAFGDRTTLNELYSLIRKQIAIKRPGVAANEPEYTGFRQGDVRHSLASIDKARERLGYAPHFSIADGIAETVSWYIDQAESRQTR